MDRERFSYSLNRETYLTAMVWTMIHFSFDDVQKRPEICRMLLKLILSPYFLKNPATADTALSPADREALALAWSLNRPTRPKDVAVHSKVSFRTAGKRLQTLAAAGMLRPHNAGKYICHYEVIPPSNENTLYIPLA